MTSAPPPMERRERALSWLLFATAFVAFAWFHPGGGWNQNARFAMVRAIVEEGTFAIDSFLVYERDRSGDGTKLERVPVRDAGFTLEGRRYAFAWHDANGRATPLAPARDGVTLVDPARFACSGDVAFHAGHFYTNKAPGSALLSVPAYLAIRGVERGLGLDPDGWRTLTVNAWLTSALSVGLVAALGCAILFRLCLILSGGRTLASVLAALSFALGTMYLPYGTMLYEHDPVAVALLASFWLLVRSRMSVAEEERAQAVARHRAQLALAGACAGVAAIANYLAAFVVVLLGMYLLRTVRRKGAWAWFGLGVLGPFLLVCAHNLLCFGTPFTTNYRYGNPLFNTEGAFLDLFVAPSPGTLAAVLVSPFRGLLVTSPIVLVGLGGLVRCCRDPGLRAEGWLMASVVGFFLLSLASFTGWDGGWAVGPRYLVPALPFLLAPAVLGFVRFPRTSCALAAVSIGMNLLVTAVDPQSPAGLVPFATMPGEPRWVHSPLTQYEWPLFTRGRAWPIVDAQRREVVGWYDRYMAARGVPAPARAQQLAALQEEIERLVRAGEPAPLTVTVGPGGEEGVALSELPTLTGPVSVNPMGMYEGWLYRLYPRGAPQVAWNSFNVGELLFPASRWSLAPLLLYELLAIAAALRLARRRDAGRA